MPECSRIFDNSIDGYAMVNIQIKKDQLQGEARRKVKFDTPEFFEEAHVPTKVSIVPRPGSQEDQDKEKQKRKKMAYDLHSEVNNSLSYLVEDANSFFCEGKSRLKPTDSQKGASSVKVGTDCSGIGIPIIALENMGICFRHIFDCDHDKDVQLTIRANHSPEVLYDNILGRDASKVPYTDLYVAGFPCQPFSTMGKQEGFEDTQGRGTIFFDILEYIRDKVPKVFILENVKGLVKINNCKDLKY